MLEDKRWKRKGADRYWAYCSKRCIWNGENAIDFRWSDEQEGDEEDIVLANFIESMQKQTDQEIIKKSSRMIVWCLRSRT